MAGGPRIVDTGATQVKVAVRWPAIRPSGVEGWTPSDPLQSVATIRMRAYRQAEWFLVHNPAIPTRQSGLDPFEQSYDLRIDPTRMIECQVSILTVSGRSVNATVVGRVTGPSLELVFDDFRVGATADVAWPALGTPVAAAFRYSLPAVPAVTLRQVQSAADAITRKKQPKGQDRGEVVLTLRDGAGRQLATDKQAYDAGAPIEGTVALGRQVAEGSTVRYSFEVPTARGMLTGRGRGRGLQRLLPCDKDAARGRGLRRSEARGLGVPREVAARGAPGTRTYARPTSATAATAAASPTRRRAEGRCRSTPHASSTVGAG